MSNDNKKLIAFTLAEVLIVLLITGVVASLVIPSVINNTQEAEYHTALKKIYSDLSQATKLIMNNNGGDLRGIYDDGQAMTNSYLSYMSYTAKCTCSGNCWHGGVGSWKWLNGNSENWYGNPSYSAILSNGYLIYFYNNIIFVDINGFKNPNMAGKDIYFFHVNINSITPFGTQGDAYENTCVSTSTGMGCTTKFLLQ